MRVLVIHCTHTSTSTRIILTTVLFNSAPPPPILLLMRGQGLPPARTRCSSITPCLCHKKLLMLGGYSLRAKHFVEAAAVSARARARDNTDWNGCRTGAWPCSCCSLCCASLRGAGRGTRNPAKDSEPQEFANLRRLGVHGGSLNSIVVRYHKERVRSRSLS